MVQTEIKSFRGLGEKFDVLLNGLDGLIGVIPEEHRTQSILQEIYKAWKDIEDVGGYQIDIEMKVIPEEHRTVEVRNAIFGAYTTRIAYLEAYERATLSGAMGMDDVGCFEQCAKPIHKEYSEKFEDLFEKYGLNLEPTS